MEELDDEQSALELLERALRYLSATAKDIDDKTIRAVLEEAFKDDGGSIMAGFVEKWIETGKEEGRQQERRNAILDILLLRFDAASPAISDRLGEINDLEILRQVNRRAATADSLAEFEQYLETLK